MPRHALSILVIAAALTAAGEARQSSGADAPRQAALMLPIGTASITGAVTGAADGQPLSSAVVTLMSLGPLPFQRTAVSDSRGSFQLLHLPAGRFTLSASRVQYLQTNYGSFAPSRGLEVQLAEGQQLRMALALVRGGVITGSVSQPDGLPVVNAQVRALRYTYVTGSRTLQPVAYGSTSTTDDRGMYRMYNLLPGDYVISVTPAINGDIAQVERAARDARAVEAAMNAAVRARTPLPRSLDVRLVMEGATTSPSGTPYDQGPLRAFAPVYFPGSATAAGATVIHLGAGEERANADIIVTPVHASHVNGTVTGMPPGSTVQLQVRNEDPAEEPVGATPRTASDGQFTLINVPPGRFRVLAQTGSRGPDRLWGQATFVVEDGPVAPLTITLQRGRTISGVVARGTDSRGAENPTAVTVSLVSVESAGSPAFGEPPQAPVDADGRFTISGVAPGRYLFRVAAGFMQSATVNGEDVLDVPFLAGHADIQNVSISLTDQETHLSGTLTDLAGAPSTTYSIVIAAADPRYWTPGSRRVAVAPPASDGKFSFRNLPPGRYALAAVGEMEPASHYDPAFLARLAQGAVSVTINPGGRHVQNLRVTR